MQLLNRELYTQCKTDIFLFFFFPTLPIFILTHMKDSFTFSQEKIAKNNTGSSQIAHLQVCFIITSAKAEFSFHS